MFVYFSTHTDSFIDLDFIIFKNEAQKQLVDLV